MLRYPVVEKVLEGWGFQHVRTRGSHHQWRAAGRGCRTIPVHGGKVRVDLWHLVLKSLASEFEASRGDQQHAGSAGEGGSTTPLPTTAEKLPAVEKQAERRAWLPPPEEVLATGEREEYLRACEAAEAARLCKRSAAETELLAVEARVHELLFSAVMPSGAGGGVILLGEAEERKLREIIELLETTLAKKKFRKLGDLANGPSLLDLEMYLADCLERQVATMRVGSAEQEIVLEKLFGLMSRAKTTWWKGEEQKTITEKYDTLLRDVFSMLSDNTRNSRQLSSENTPRTSVNLLIWLTDHFSRTRDENRARRLTQLAEVFRVELVAIAQQFVFAPSRESLKELHFLKADEKDCISAAKKLLQKVGNLADLYFYVVGGAGGAGESDGFVLDKKTVRAVGNLGGHIRCECGKPMCVKTGVSFDAAEVCTEALEASAAASMPSDRLAFCVRNEYQMLSWIRDYLVAALQLQKTDAGRVRFLTAARGAGACASVGWRDALCIVQNIMRLVDIFPSDSFKFVEEREWIVDLACSDLGLRTQLELLFDVSSVLSVELVFGNPRNKIPDTQRDAFADVFFRAGFGLHQRMHTFIEETRNGETERGERITEAGGGAGVMAMPSSDDGAQSQSKHSTVDEQLIRIERVKWIEIDDPDKMSWRFCCDSCTVGGEGYGHDLTHRHLGKHEFVFLYLTHSYLVPAILLRILSATTGERSCIWFRVFKELLDNVGEMFSKTRIHGQKLEVVYEVLFQLVQSREVPGGGESCRVAVEAFEFVKTLPGLESVFSYSFMKASGATLGEMLVQSPGVRRQGSMCEESAPATCGGDESESDFWFDMFCSTSSEIDHIAFLDAKRKVDGLHKGEKVLFDDFLLKRPGASSSKISTVWPWEPDSRPSQFRSLLIGLWRRDELRPRLGGKMHDFFFGEGAKACVEEIEELARWDSISLFSSACLDVAQIRTWEDAIRNKIGSKVYVFEVWKLRTVLLARWESFCGGRGASAMMAELRDLVQDGAADHEEADNEESGGEES